MFQSFVFRLRRLFAAQDGTIAVMGVLALTSVLGMSGMAVELGNGYAAKVRNQRVADLAAIGAAVAYKSGGQTTDVATKTAKDIAVANGYTTANSTVDASVVAVGTTNAVKVTVTTSVPIRLARLISSKQASYTVSNTAYASLTKTVVSAAGCITTLSSGTTSISADGGASIKANGCNINTNGTIYSSNSSAKVSANSIGAKAINDTAAAYHQNAITATIGITLGAGAASDFIGPSNTAVKDALCQVNKLTGQSDTYNATTNPYGYVGGNTSCTSLLVVPSAISSSGGADWNLSYQPRSAGGIYAYQDGDYSCKYYPPGNATYNIGTLNVGSCTIVFAAGTTLNVDTLTIGGGGNFTFGDGTLKVKNGLTLSGGVNVTVGNGSHSFGSITVGGGSNLKVGNGNLLVVGKLAVDGGGSNVYFNIKDGETVTIGSDGTTAINVSGGAKLCFTGWNSGSSTCAAASAAAGTFSANGTVTTSGGSLLTFPNSATHVLNGDVTLQSGAVFGAGLYIIKGNWTNGTGGAMTGTNVTFALGGSYNFAGGTSFDLAAPTSSSTYGITDILIATKTSSGTSISAGSNGKASGVIYAPNSAFSSTGGSGISSNGSQCMMLLVNSISVTGSGTINISGCTSQRGTTTTTGTVALIK